MKEINIAWMYPDILNLHGERANLMSFKINGEKLGIKINIDRIDDLNEIIKFDKYDILVFNACELRVIDSIVNALEEQKKSLDEYVNSNKIILLTGTSGAIFANNINLKNKSFKGLNYLDMDVQELSMIVGNDIHFKFNKLEIIGSQIQMLDITLNNVKPLGNIIYGYGNNGTNSEGARYKNIYFTNCLGPLLVKNPWLVEYFINLVLKNKNINVKLKKCDYKLEKLSLKSQKKFLEYKVANKK